MNLYNRLKAVNEVPTEYTFSEYILSAVFLAFPYLEGLITQMRARFAERGVDLHYLQTTLTIHEDHHPTKV
eukprot:138918-Chlamydomonas_euryale.AAC.2